jgi:hypothetical protein
MATWVRGLSIPAAMLGTLGFFLPWVAVSCGPMRVTVSGYEMATGSYRDKLSQQGIDSFWNRTGDELNRQMGSRSKSPSKAPKANKRSVLIQKQQDTVPALWSIPIACLMLVLLAVLGLPRTPTIVVSALAVAYLAYFGISSEQQLNDPRNTGGIFTHEWLVGYWLGWIGLLGPMFIAILRPKERPQEVTNVAEG